MGKHVIGRYRPASVLSFSILGMQSVWGHTWKPVFLWNFRWGKYNTVRVVYSYMETAWTINFEYGRLRVFQIAVFFFPLPLDFFCTGLLIVFTMLFDVILVVGVTDDGLAKLLLVKRKRSIVLSSLVASIVLAIFLIALLRFSFRWSITLFVSALSADM